MNRQVKNRVQKTIARAESPAEVWALVQSLLDNPNGYTELTILENARAYAKIATEMYAKEM